MYPRDWFYIMNGLPLKGWKVTSSDIRHQVKPFPIGIVMQTINKETRRLSLQLCIVATTGKKKPGHLANRQRVSGTLVACR